MKLRFSNLTDYATSFEANDVASFMQEANAALRIFRAATARPIHRGEIRKNVLWFDRPSLHIFDERRWLNLGYKKQVPTPYLGNLLVWVLSPVDIPGHEAAFLDEQASLDASWLEEHSNQVWQKCVDTWQWVYDLGALIGTVGDDIRRCEQSKL